jgi:hypothetical protein
MSNFLEHGGIPQHRNLNIVVSSKFNLIFFVMFPFASLPLAPQLVQMEVEPWPNNLEKKRDDNGNMMGTYWERIKNKENSLSPTPFEPQKEKNMYKMKC